MSLFLNKSWRYINSALANENEKNHFNSFSLLKSAAKTLENFMSDIDNHKLDKRRKTLIVDLIKKLNECSRQIEAASNIMIDLECDSTVDNVETKNESASLSIAKNETNVLNDWVLSEFNLLSNDFNSDLAFIAGNMFDLNFNFKICKTLNNHKCFVMKSRNPNLNSKFVLKVMQNNSLLILIPFFLVGRKIEYHFFNLPLMRRLLYVSHYQIFISSRYLKFFKNFESELVRDLAVRFKMKIKYIK